MVIEPLQPAIEPVEAYRRIRCGRGRGFILSVEGGRRGYTVVGFGPSVVVDVWDHSIVVDGTERPLEDPFEYLSGLIKESLGDGCAAPFSPFPFSAGLVGFFGYELGGLIEPSVRADAPARKPPIVPLASAGVYRTTYIYDHNTHRGYIASMDGPRGVERLRRLLEENRPTALPFEADPEWEESSFTELAYRRAIEEALDYIKEGDIYQINLSQRLKFQATGDGLTLFEALYRRGAGRFASFMEFEGFQIISNTPERLLRVKEGFAEIEPIKGTRPRGRTPEEDIKIVEELRNDPKERAEHLMIVDLVRNDLGRFAVAGSVEVRSFQRIESLPHLHHMVSTVRARLPHGMSPLMALKECFPGGSVTGTPKIRAMEIIRELEPVPRGVYTGGLGWVDISGRMDIAMAIRTALYTKPNLYLHVGGGIVADSVPEREYRETLLKAEDFVTTLERLKGCTLKSSEYI